MIFDSRVFKKKTSYGNIEQKLRNRLLTIANKLMVTGGEVGRGMGEVDQSDLGYAYADEH